MQTVNLSMMDRLLQIAGLSGQHTLCSIPDTLSYLKYGWLYD